MPVPPARRRAAVSLRQSVRSVVESLECRCLLTGTASAGVPWEGDTAGTMSLSDYNPATISVFAEAAAFEEQQQSGWFRFHRSYSFNCGCGCGGGLDSPLTVDYGIDPSSTATPTDDYYPLSGHVDFPAGASDVDVYLQPNDDHVVEDTESVRLNVLDDHPDQYAPDPVYWYSTNYIIDNEPTVSISATDTADEQGATTGRFTITRTTEMYAALDVDLLIGGTASPGTDYTLTDADTGEPIAGSVTIPEGEYSTDVIVTPIDDATPEWTETVTATLAPGDPAEFRLGQSSSAVAQIVDNDFGFTLQQGTLVANYDDDNNNGVADYNDTSGGGDDDLYEMQLKVPRDPKPGTSITVNLPPDMVNAYDSQSKGHKLLGDDPNVGTIRFDDDNPAPSSIWLEVKKGSAEENDLLVSASREDLGTRPSGGSQSQRNTAVNVKVVSNNDPNGGAAGDVTSKTIDKWLVGQMVDLSVQIEAPPSLQQSPTYQWSVPAPGGQPPLYTYVEVDGGRTAVPLGNDHAVAIGPDATKHTGKKQQEVQFFWTKIGGAAPGPDSNDVSVQVSGVAGANLPPAKVTFKVFSPTVVAPEVHQGAAQLDTVSQKAPRIGLLSSATWTLSGMAFRARVDVPAGFQAGEWNYLQLGAPSRHYTRSDTGGFHLRDSGIWGLDTSVVYPAPADDAFNAPSGSAWTTGAPPHYVIDSPDMSLTPGNPQVNYLEGSIDEAYNTFIMFRPVGASSQWVPLQSADWGYRIKALHGATWSVDQSVPPTQSHSEFTPFTEIPQWGRVWNIGTAPFDHD